MRSAEGEEGMQTAQVGLHGRMSNGSTDQQSAQGVPNEADPLRQFVQRRQVVEDLADERLREVLHVAVGGIAVDAVAHKKVQRMGRQGSLQVSAHLKTDGKRNSFINVWVNSSNMKFFNDHIAKLRKP